MLDYVAQDWRLTLDVAEASEKANKNFWLTGCGTISHFELSGGWLTAQEASKLQLPHASRREKPGRVQNLQSGGMETACIFVSQFLVLSTLDRENSSLSGEIFPSFLRKGEGTVGSTKLSTI
ncbi:MAG: hypothetical protein JSU60_07040 [Nitrospirota bacterium]|nr:MAG: hypothetical protein JSU60_07040 [Nitrospirota bacterium]